MTVSVIISARNEYPNIVHTVHSIFNDLETFLSPSEFEILVVDNCSDDTNPRGRSKSGTVDYLMPRGAYARGVLRVMYYPVASNVGARHFGALAARGKYIFFCDAHISVSYGTFSRWVKTIDESGGLVHPSMDYIGAYPAGRIGLQYSWKLGEEFKGTWNNYMVGKGDDWFYVPGQGHCSVGCRRDQYFEFGGYFENRCYGGGEMYLDTLWWMMGSSSVTEPRAHVYHLGAERGYSYQHDDYVHNVFACALALGADMWAERTYINYLRKGRKEVLDRLWEEAVKTARPHKTFNEKAPYTFNSIIINRPWDIGNRTKFGKSNSGMLIFHDTWLPLLEESPQAKEAYENSQYQQELAEFIDAYLSNFVYKRS